MIYIHAKLRMASDKHVISDQHVISSTQKDLANSAKTNKQTNKQTTKQTKQENHA